MDAVEIVITESVINTTTKCQEIMDGEARHVVVSVHRLSRTVYQDHGSYN